MDDHAALDQHVEDRAADHVQLVAGGGLAGGHPLIAQVFPDGHVEFVERDDVVAHAGGGAAGLLEGERSPFGTDRGRRGAAGRVDGPRLGVAWGVGRRVLRPRLAGSRGPRLGLREVRQLRRQLGGRCGRGESGRVRAGREPEPGPVHRSARRQGEAVARPADWPRDRRPGAGPEGPVTVRHRTARWGLRARPGRVLAGSGAGVMAGAGDVVSIGGGSSAAGSAFEDSETKGSASGAPVRPAAGPARARARARAIHPRPRPARSLGDEWGGPAFRGPTRPRWRLRGGLLFGQVSEAAGRESPASSLLLMISWIGGTGARPTGGEFRATLGMPERLCAARQGQAEHSGDDGEFHPHSPSLETRRAETRSRPCPGRRDRHPRSSHPTGSLDSKTRGVTSRADGAEMGNAATGYPPPLCLQERLHDSGGRDSLRPRRVFPRARHQIAGTTQGPGGPVRRGAGLSSTTPQPDLSHGFRINEISCHKSDFSPPACPLYQIQSWWAGRAPMRPRGPPLEADCPRPMHLSRVESEAGLRSINSTEEENHP